MKHDDYRDSSMTEIARKTRDSLAEKYGQREAEAMSWIILEHLTGQRRGQLMARSKARLHATQLDSLRRIAEEILTGRPLQYVLGETEFYGLRLKVGPEVLIPRPETEELVDWILRDCAQRRSGLRDREPLPTLHGEGSGAGGPMTVLDIGTGSGCIAVALAKHLPAATIRGCDVSEDALQLARENARRNNVPVRFEQADMLDASARERFPSFDLLVSNPPYVTRSEMDGMASNVVEYEPHLALFVENNDPLLFYREIAAFAVQKLHAGGWLYVEINEAFGRETCQLLKKTGLCQVELRKDIHGKDRMIKAVKAP